MKYKIGFKLDWLEMIFLIAMIFAAGIFINTNLISSGLLIFGAGIVIMKKKIKIHNNKQD